MNELTGRSRILIVEDDQMLLQFLRLHLHTLGYEVVGTARSGREALRLAQTLIPDLILLDIMLEGGMDGIEVAQRLRDQLQIPFIFVSGQDEQAMFDRARLTEPYAYVLKPINPHELGLTIELALERAARQRANEASFRMYFEHPSDAVLLTAPDGHVLNANAQACRLFGWTAEEFRSVPRTALVDPTNPRVAAALEERQRTGSYVGELPMIRKDGTQLNCEVSSVIFKDRNGLQRTHTVVRDITERKLTEQARARLAAIVENSNDAIMSRSLDGTITSWNAAAERLYGYTAAEAIGQPITILFPPGKQSEAARHSATLQVGDQIPATEVVRRTKDGRLIKVLRSISPIRDENGEIVGGAIITRDITELKRAEKALIEAEALFRQFANIIPEAFWVREADSQQILLISPGWQTITGWPPPRRRQEFLDIVHPDDYDEVLAETERSPDGGVDIEYRIVRRDGVTRWLHVRTYPILNEANVVYRVAGVAEDITERKLVEERLLQIAHYDGLTNLPNRTLFYESMKRILDNAGQQRSTVGVMFVDLDRFKVVNDSLGHAMGDELLQQVAARLVACVRVRDVVGRLGGDEFALIVPALDSPDAAAAVAIKLLNAFAQPFELSGREAFVSASIGITIYPDDATDADTLLRYADAAMYRAKAEGRNAYRYYTAEMNARAQERLELESALRHAQERQEFELHYQPKLDLRSGEISGVEALLRWQRPGVGLVGPAEFIPVLEETGQIVSVGEWVISQACRQIRAWEQEGLRPVPIAVNLSARQFHRSDLSLLITQALQAHGVRAELLEFELTESTLMSQATDAHLILNEIKTLGTRISVDDFGTGYSSLGYLKRFPINVIKIDRTFVKDIMNSWEDASLTLAVIDIAHNLGMQVVAEGVETLEQLAFLAANGCNEIQGYIFHRPLKAADITGLMRDYRAGDNPAAVLGKDSYRASADVSTRIAEYQKALRAIR